MSCELYTCHIYTELLHLKQCLIKTCLVILCKSAIGRSQKVQVSIIYQIEHHAGHNIESYLGN